MEWIFEQGISTEKIVDEILDAVTDYIELSPSDFEELKEGLLKRYA